MDSSINPGSGAPTPGKRSSFTGEPGETSSAAESSSNREMGAEPTELPTQGPAQLAVSYGGGGQPADQALPRWATRLLMVIEVLIWVELGMILVVVPWKPAWHDNSLILNFPRLREFLSQDFVRGVVTGIGLLDLWAGISRAIRYRDPVRTDVRTEENPG